MGQDCGRTARDRDQDWEVIASSDHRPKENIPCSINVMKTSPDCSMLVTGGNDNLAMCWNINPEELKCEGKFR